MVAAWHLAGAANGSIAPIVVAIALGPSNTLVGPAEPVEGVVEMGPHRAVDRLTPRIPIITRNSDTQISRAVTGASRFPHHSCAPWI